VWKISLRVLFGKSLIDEFQFNSDIHLIFVSALKKVWGKIPSALAPEREEIKLAFKSIKACFL
jgi:hypothetical protein|tara:strand:+ start:762 stop:950 length:189 start_codon:yes stop_codon:yes gene_type:complete